MLGKSIVQDDEVSLKLGATKDVSEFLASRPKLDRAACLELVEQAICLVDGVYVHLPLKRATYAVDPVRRLQLLKVRLEQLEPDKSFDDLWFHREMVDTYTSMRDLHTMYILPGPFDRSVAFVPFRIESYFAGSDRKYIVTQVLKGLPEFNPKSTFIRGVEVTHWNDIPMARAVELIGIHDAGSNPDAQLARGLSKLTVRPLSKSLPPDEAWVTVQYRGPDQKEYSQRAQWRVATFGSVDKTPSEATMIQDMAEGLDHETDLISTWNKLIYSPAYQNKNCIWHVDGKQHGRSAKSNEFKITGTIKLSKVMGDTLEAKTFQFEGKEYGHIRLRTFKNKNDNFLMQFASLLEQMPEGGLVLDIRDNPGGYLQVGEKLLQTLTPNPIEPETAQFINTPSSLMICNALDIYESWRPSMQEAVKTGTTFSAGIPLSDKADCNRIGQRYYGPVILVTNALCYSTADVFAAGFQDHDIGIVLGVDSTTGAGGAEVVLHSALCDRFNKSVSAAEAHKKARRKPEWPFCKLSRGDLRFAIRRTLRVGRQSGTILEDLGVASQIRYQMTRDDVLGNNIDLLCAAARHLARQPSYQLREKASSFTRSEREITVQLQTRGLDRVDICLDGGWASASAVVGDCVKEVSATLPPDGIATHLYLRGFKDGKRVAARKIRLPPPPRR